MNTLDYVLDNLKDAAEHRYPKATVTVTTKLVHGTDNFSVIATVKEPERRRVVTEISATWDEVSTLVYADQLLRRCLELVCHIYKNELRTEYYTHAIVIEVMPTWREMSLQEAPRLTPKGRVSMKPNIAKMVKLQLEQDEAWEANNANT